MSDEKLRDAIAALVHARTAEDSNHDCHHTDRWAGFTAVAILALPEMVAAMKVVEAARQAGAFSLGRLTLDDIAAAVEAFDAVMGS